MPAKASLASLGALGSADVVIVLGLEDLDALNLVEREKGKSGKKCFLVQFYFLFFRQKKKKRSSTGAFAYDSRKRKTKT